MTSKYLQKIKKNWKLLYTPLEYTVKTEEWNLVWAMLVIKSGKRHLTDGMELPNQDKIRTFEEKETYKYLVILEEDTIKQVEMKEKKLWKNISGELETYSRQNYLEET